MDGLVSTGLDNINNAIVPLHETGLTAGILGENNSLSSLNYGHNPAGFSLPNSGFEPSVELANISTTDGEITVASDIDGLTGMATTNGKFETYNGKIYDPNGREFVAKGVNLNGPGFGWPGNPVSYVDEIEKWGFNAIRLNVKEIEPSQYKYAENGTIDSIVQAYTQAGIVVMIEPHEETGGWFEGQELDELVNWHSNLAERYKDNPYVWLNVSNEPGGLNSPANKDKYLNQNTQVIQAIRGKGFENPIIVNGWYWGQDGNTKNSNVPDSDSAILSVSDSLLAVDRTANKGNDQLVFSLHTYLQWSYGDGKLANFVDRVQAKKLPFVIGEYGTQGNGDLNDATTKSVLGVAPPRNVGRFAWSWWGGDYFDLTKSGNGGGQNTQFKSDGSMPDNLTWFGQQVWQDNRRQENLGWLPSQDQQSPVASLKAVNLTEATTTPFSFTVSYSDNVAIARNSIDSNDITVTSANGFSQVAVLDNVSNSQNGTPLVATYRINAPGGSWDNADNSTYTISMRSNQVADVNNNFVPAGVLGSFNVSIPNNSSNLRIEAENMQLSGYGIENTAVASGGKIASLLNTGKTSGTASTTFNGVARNYDVVVGAFDENDGKSPISVQLANNQYSFILDRNLGHWGPDEKTKVRQTVAKGAYLTPGTSISITGQAQGQELARVDYIEFIPV